MQVYIFDDMRYLSCLLLVLIPSILLRSYAQAPGEEQQVGRILLSLQTNTQSNYLGLFPSYDTLHKMVMQYTEANENEMRKLANLQRNVQRLQQFDPLYNPALASEFDWVYKKGRDSGLHWSDLVMARYELEKMMLPRELIGLNKIMPLRLQGYIFVEDMLTRRRYIVGVRDIFTIKDKWYGGRLVNVLEAETIDEYLEKLAHERKIEKEKLLNEMYGVAEVPEVTDSAKAATKVANTEEEDDEEEETRKEVVERKYYKGTFDNEMSVELYMRGMKGLCNENVCSWEAMYRFQDMDEFIKLEVTKGPDGTWIFNEEPEIGVMELKLKGDNFTGTWMSLKDKTEYEVHLAEKKEVKGKKLMQLDTIMENNMFSN